MTAPPMPPPETLEVDLAVIGSGAAGLSAAVTAAARGLRVAVLEKASKLGGTSAWRSGWMCIPCQGVGAADDRSERLDAADRRAAETGLRASASQAGTLEAAADAPASERTAGQTNGMP